MKENIKKVYVLDFDKTIVDTLEPDEIKSIWKEKTGEDWKFKGIWGRGESLDMNIFNFQTIPHVIDEYNKIKDDETIYKVLLTGRIKPLENQVKHILNHYNLSFDEHLFNNMNDTKIFKLRELTKLLNEFNDIDELHLFDDRIAHADTFIDFTKDINYQANKKLMIFNFVTKDNIEQYF